MNYGRTPGVFSNLKSLVDELEDYLALYKVKCSREKLEILVEKLKEKKAINEPVIKWLEQLPLILKEEKEQRNLKADGKLFKKDIIKAEKEEKRKKLLFAWEAIGSIQPPLYNKVVLMDIHTGELKWFKNSYVAAREFGVSRTAIMNADLNKHTFRKQYIIKIYHDSI